MFAQNELMEMLLSLPAILFGISIHEFAHAYVAVRFGDDTPRRQGRLTLNPLAHFDPIGFLMLILVRFGWAKPVLINPEVFPHPKRDEIWVAVAGPLANLISAVCFTILFKLLLSYGRFLVLLDNYGVALAKMVVYFIVINIALAVFNLIPIPPLDGSHLISVLIPEKYASIKSYLYRFGIIGLILIIILNRATGLDLLPIGKAVNAILGLLYKVVGIR